MLGRVEDALGDLDRALDLAPGYAEAQWNKSTLLLLLGRYAEGWPLFESRWKTRLLRPAFRSFGQPLWLGQPSAAASILLHAEQGYGDTIQFLRYAPLLTARGMQVMLELPPALIPLASGLRPGVAAYRPGEAPATFDCHCPLMSLPLACGTRLDSIPDSTPYLFPDAEREARWRELLGPRARLRIGIAWSGSPAHPQDRWRSIPLHVLAPLLELDHEYHVLQAEVRAEDRAALAVWPDLRRHGLHDFADTAALIGEMDLVISADTAAAHLAGALGKPLWLLLPHVPDYRWLLGREDSPWYPTARLFRQDAHRDWNSVIARVRLALGRLTAELRSAPTPSARPAQRI
jgi:hypothetical protein